MSYHVEWRVINAADYGMPQQRRRVFILAYRNSSYGTPDTNGNQIMDAERLALEDQ